MTLVQLMYVSQEVEGLALADYRDIVRAAQRNNRRDGLTGALVSARPYFIQCLEGPRSIVSALLERLYRDPRHTRIQLVEMREIDTREFADWDMRLIRSEELDGESLRRVCLRHGVDLPFRLAAVRAAQLCKWLRELHGLFARTEEPTRLPPNATDSATLSG
jgi:Sensors of blue-light using FAD